MSPEVAVYVFLLFVQRNEKSFLLNVETSFEFQFTYHTERILLQPDEQIENMFIHTFFFFLFSLIII